MAKLAQVFAESSAKNSYQMRDFFQGVIDHKELQAYSVEIDKETVIKDTVDERILKTVKGATLTPISKLEYTERIKRMSPTFIEHIETGVMYNLDLSRYEGTYSTHHSNHDVFHECNIERLAECYDPKKIEMYVGPVASLEDTLSIPSNMITATLNMSCNETLFYNHGEGDNLGGWKLFSSEGELKIKGELDKLFAQTLVFLKTE